MSIVYKNLLVSTSVVFCYLFVEWIYNQHLLVLLSYDYINPENFQFTEVFGKAIASFGLNLILNSIFKKFSLARFSIGLILGYVFLTYVFNYAVNAFPNDFRYSSYYSMLYRKDVINGNDKSEILKFTENSSWYEKSLVISQFVYVLKDEQWKEFEKKVKQPVSEKVNKLNKNRSQYYQEYKKFDNSYDKIIKAWGKYSSAEANYMAYKGFYKGDARKKFIQKVGLPPNLSLDEFIQKVSPNYNKAANTTLFEGSSESKLSPIYLKDLPKKMNSESFNNYIDNEIKRITTQLAPEVDNIRENKNSFDSLAILVIPPISICLSLFSILINILILLSKWSYYIFKIEKVNLTIYSCVFIALCCGFIFTLASFQTTLTENDNYWNKVRELNHEQHPVLFDIFTTGLKLEPVLCVTKEQPKFIQSFTEQVYKSH